MNWKHHRYPRSRSSSSLPRSRKSRSRSRATAGLWRILGGLLYGFLTAFFSQPVASKSAGRWMAQTLWHRSRK